MRLLVDTFKPPSQEESARLKRSAIFCLVVGLAAPPPLGIGWAVARAHELLPRWLDLPLMLGLGVLSSVLAGMGLHRLLWGHPRTSHAWSPEKRGLISVLATLLILYASGQVARALLRAFVG